MEEIDYKILLDISQSTATVRTRDELEAFIDDKVKPCFSINEHWVIRIYKPERNTLEVWLTNKLEQEDSEAFMRLRQPDPVEGFFKTIIEASESVHLDESWKNSPKTTQAEKNAEQFWRDFNIKYCLSVALRSFGQAIGTFQAFFNEHKAFTESQQQLFKSLADQIAIALVNVLANEKALEREREKDLLLSVSEQMATIRERADLRRVLTQIIKPLINFDDAFVIVLSEDQTRYSHFLVASSSDYRKTVDSDSSMGSPMLPVSDTPLEYLLTLPSPHVLYNKELPTRYSDPLPGLGTSLKDFISFRLQWGDRLVGLFLLRVESIKHQPESKLSLYKAIANQIAVAVGMILTNEEVAHLAEECSRRAEELSNSNEAIARTSERLSGLTDLSAFLGQVTLEAVRQLNANAGVLLIRDETDNTFQPMALFEGNELFTKCDIPAWATYEEAAIWRELQEIRRPRQFDLAKETDLFCGSFLTYHHERSHKMLLLVPLFVADKPLGCLALSFLEASPIDKQRTELVTTLAHQAALAIKLTRLADGTRREVEQAATLAERNRIAREIHDALAQGFTGVIFQLETAKRVLGETTPAGVSKYVARSIELAREGLAQARRSVQTLRPPAEDLQLDLPLLLREKLTALTVDTDIETGFSVVGTPLQFPPETILNLLRIGQEAITNALRHSRAHRITVELDYDGGVHLRVADDGIGFETADEIQDGGYGLRGMRERAAAIKARLNVRSKRGNGTSVSVRLGK